MSKARGKGKDKGNKESGKSKKEKSKKDGKYTVPRLVELENHFLMRMPEPYASNLQEALDNGGLKDRLQIEFKEDARNGKVVFDGVNFSAKLLDLPCIVESWKTFDKKSLWKTGDVSQMLVCKDPEEPSFSSDGEDNNSFDYFKKRLHEAKKYQYPHGITAPLKNVRRRRFRKTAKQKYVDAPESEKEVKRLLRTDVSAVSVTFDIINDEQEKVKAEEEMVEDIEVVDIDIGGGPSVDQFDENSNMSSVLGGGSDNETRDADTQDAGILPDISSSEDEGDGGLENIIQQRSEIQQRLREVQAKVSEQQTRVENAANPFLKQRFQSVLDDLRLEEESLTQQYTALS